MHTCIHDPTCGNTHPILGSRKGTVWRDHTYIHAYTHTYMNRHTCKHAVICENAYPILDLRGGTVWPPPLPTLAPMNHRYDMCECEFKDYMDTCACLFKDHMDIGI